VTAGDLRCVVDLTALESAPVGDPTPAVVGLFERLRAAALGGAAELLVVTGLAGAFEPVGAAAHGLVKTFDRELPAVRCRVVDVAADDDPLTVATQLLAELGDAEAPVEVAYVAGRRCGVELAALALPDDHAASGTGEGNGQGHRPSTPATGPVLGPDSVLLITGGARGIGARSALALARRFGCRIELVGRTPEPAADGSDEAPDLVAAPDAVALRQALVARADGRTPGEIEAETQRVLVAREVRRTLAELRRHASAVGYHAVDVSDPEAVESLLSDLRSRCGRLDGVVHAAGVLEDKLIRHKTADSFARVFATKVAAARLLADGVDDGGFVVLFASVSGVFGNAGQVDYAAANSVLDALARSHPGRVVAVDWGPWRAGMVTPELAREYHRRGIGLIDPDEGVEALLAELDHGIRDPQVVLMCAVPMAVAAGARR
jgi:NAD(P)-dependent dehydrogenase (short-subunit alcohol dehydrogenase family)